MKRILEFFLILIPVFLITSFFIPAIRQNEIPVNNTFENIISTLYQPKNWIKWNPSVSKAWLKDSSACKFREDTVAHVVTIEIPGKKITVSRISYLFYQLEETSDSHVANCAISIIPYIGNRQPRSEHNARMIYAGNTNLFYKMLPFLDRRSFTEITVKGLKSFLDDPLAYYGYPFSIKKVTDSLFITRKETLTKEEFFKKLPLLFDSLAQYAKQNNLQPGSRNIYYNSLSTASYDILAGININRPTDGDYIFQFMQMPGSQYLAIAHFEGRFRDKSRVYEAMNKYLWDHQLIRLGVSYEKYLSPLPAADSSLIKMDLTFPLRNN